MVHYAVPYIRAHTVHFSVLHYTVHYLVPYSLDFWPHRTICSESQRSVTHSLLISKCKCVLDLNFSLIPQSQHLFKLCWGANITFVLRLLQLYVKALHSLLYYIYTAILLQYILLFIFNRCIFSQVISEFFSTNISHAIFCIMYIILLLFTYLFESTTSPPPPPHHFPTRYLARYDISPPLKKNHCDTVLPIHYVLFFKIFLIDVIYEYILFN